MWLMLGQANMTGQNEGPTNMHMMNMHDSVLTARTPHGTTPGLGV